MTRLRRAPAAALRRDGAIVAVKGIGGYHLACRADDEAAVAALRARKHREDKPFALMVADLRRRGAPGRSWATPSGRCCSRPSAPDRARPAGGRAAPVAAAVAPGAPELGVMLPYSPLHHLLLADCRRGRW